MCTIKLQLFPCILSCPSIGRCVGVGQQMYSQLQHLESSNHISLLSNNNNNNKSSNYI